MTTSCRLCDGQSQMNEPLHVGSCHQSKHCGEHDHTIPLTSSSPSDKTESLTLADFYSGHSRNIPPLQWWIIAPAFSVDQPSDYKCTWQNEEELSFYQKEYSRTGFQGGLHWYRCRFEAAQQKELQQYVGKKIEVPAIFISGRQDWGIYQIPGAIEKMKNEACTQMKDIKLIDQAGHWVQQEQPQQVVKHLLEFVIRSNHSR